MDDLGRLTCRCLLDFHRSLELTTTSSVSQHDGNRLSTSNNLRDENRSGDEASSTQASPLGEESSELITELSLVVIPCTHHNNIPIEYSTTLLKVNIAIKTMEASLLRISPGDTKSKVMHFVVLSRLRHLRWIQHSQKSDLAAATSYLRSCTRSPVIDSFHQGIFYGEMAIYLHSRYALHEDQSALESAIECIQKSIELIRRASPTRPLNFFIWRLAFLLFCQFQCTQKTRFLDESITNLHQAMITWSHDQVALAACYRLAVRELTLRFELCQNRADLDQAIFFHQLMGDLPHRALQSLDRARPGASRRGRNISTLYDWQITHSSLLLLRFTDTGQSRDLQSAIDMVEPVLEILSEGDTLREEAFACLVSCLMQRFRVHGRLEDLGRIRALVVDDPAPSINNVYNLGKLLLTAFEWFRQPELIDEAVEYLHQCVDLARTVQARKLPQNGNAETSEMEEFTFAQAALEQRYGAEVISRYTRRSWRQGVFSPDNSLMHVSNWIQETSRLHDLGRAITIQLANSLLYDKRQMTIALTVLRLAEQLAPRNSSQRWEYLFSLGTCHRVRHEIIPEQIELGGTRIGLDIKRAIELQSKAVEKLHFLSPRRVPAVSSLAHSLLRSASYLGDESQYYKAIELLEQVADAFYGFIHDRLEGAILWASLLHSKTYPFEDEQTRLQRSLEGYQKAISLLARAAWIGLSTSSRLARLHSVPKTFASDAAACAIRLAELQTEPQQREEYLGKAVELLDQGRAVLWSGASQLRADLRLLSSHDPELAVSLDKVGHELARTAFKDGNADSGRTTEALAHQWEDLVERVRELDGFQDFLKSISFTKLREAAASTTTIIVNISEHRCDAIIIPSQGSVRLVPLPKLSKSQVDDNVQEILGVLPYYDDRGELEAILSDLWLSICQPVLTELREIGVVGQKLRTPPHVRWCLTGRLAFLPIHAAGPRYQSRRKPGMLDWVTSSYISTLSMLLRAQQRREALQGQVPVPRVLAVCHSGGDERGRLPKAKEEVEILCSCLEPEAVSVIMDKAARVDAVSDALKKSNWVHFACHGTQNKTNPMDSALVLDDGRLPVSKLAEQNLKGEFAMLLACETAMGMPGLSDEAIHVAAGLHFAGFNGVIATMWSICDEHGPIVAEKVYKYLFRRKQDESPADALEAAYALRKALLYLRDKEKLPARDWAPFMHFGL